MDLFGRYVFKQATNALLLVLFSLTTVVWLATVLKELKLVTAQGQNAGLFLQMTALALPNLMAIIAPIALLIACFHTLSRLNADSELIVMNASGATIWRVAKPYLLLALIVSLFLVATNLYIMPASLRLLRELVVQVRTDFISQVLQPGRFSSPERGLTFYIRDRDRADNLYGLVVHDERDNAQTMSYLAEKARIQKQDDKAILIMTDGQIHRRKTDDPNIQIIEFDNYIFDLSQFGASSGSVQLKPRERFLHELINPDPKDPLYKRNPGKFRAEIHERLSNPLYPILFALIAVAALGPARTTRQSRTQIVIMGFVIAATLRVCGLAATNLLTLHPWAVILVYGVPVSAIILTIWIAHARMTPKKGSNFGLGWGTISQAIERLTFRKGRRA